MYNDYYKPQIMSPDKRFNFANEVFFSGKKIIKTNQNCSQ